MFDIGFSELLVIAVVALIVLGPERLPKAARFAGLWVRRARAQWYSVRDELERELAADELKRGVDAARQSLHDVEQSIRAEGETARQALEDAREDIDNALSGREAAPASGQVHAPIAGESAPAGTPGTEAPAELPAAREDDLQADLFAGPERRR